MKALGWLFFLILTVVVTWFSVVNRGLVSLSLDPLPYQIDLPLYLVVLASILLGMVLGGLTAWARAGRWRRLARHGVKEVRHLKQDLKQTEDRLHVSEDKLEAVAPPKGGDSTGKKLIEKQG